MPAHKSINLLPKTEFEVSFWGRFLKWSLTAGRYIIILTEMVVILAFLSRFKLDKDLQDLNDNIAGKRNILEATYQIEVDFRAIQNRLVQAKGLLAQSPAPTVLLDALTTDIPSGIGYKTIAANFDTRQVTIAAVAPSEPALGQFVSALTSNKTWKESSIDSIASDQTTGITFNLTLAF